MKVLIIGSGRMGIRHAIGASLVSEISEITIIDISNSALVEAKKQLSHLNNFNLILFKNLSQISLCKNYDIGIISTTANDRIIICKKILDTGCKNILIEKPLGQSLNEVLEIESFFKLKKVNVYVNLNMRMNPEFLKLKRDITNKTQFNKPPTITINTGSLGIGANGIHYVDFIIFLLDADNFKIISSSIDKVHIESGRGTNFKDFGGWCLIEFYRNNQKAGTCFLSMNSNSSVFGGIDIVSTHGRITINESSGKRIDYLRSAESQMPVSRYHADYTDPNQKDFKSISLIDLTKSWVESLVTKNKILLPTIQESILAHKLIFDWLSYNDKTNSNFPIT